MAEDTTIWTCKQCGRHWPWNREMCWWCGKGRRPKRAPQRSERLNVHIDRLREDIGQEGEDSDGE